MNLLIDFLNRAGAHWVPIAWSIFLQSSLLIAALFILDHFLRPRVTAAFRHALWLLVLIKLVLPPTLAFPTSPGYWLRDKARAARTATKPAEVVVRYTDVKITGVPSVQPPPPPSLTGAGALVFVWGVTATMLFCFLAARSFAVRRLVRDASMGSPELVTLLQSCCREISFGHVPLLKISISSGSPAVCGLLRPVVLIPASLVGQISSAKMRPILLHEVLHLQRRDLLVNGLQSLLQILFWFHPLLWLANRKIRTVREEAVDERVMMLTRTHPDLYPGTLIEVARLNLCKPNTALALMGILEPQHALKYRIGLLLDRPVQTSQRWGPIRIGCLLVFASVSLPLARGKVQDAPVSVERSPVAAGQRPNIEILIQDAKVLFEMGKIDQAEEKLNQALRLDPTNRAAQYYADLVRETKIAPSGTNALVSRRFRVDPATVKYGLLHIFHQPVRESGNGELLRHVISQAGVPITPPNAIFYNEETGLLLVRTTDAQFRLVQQVVESLTVRIPQVVIEGKIFESRGPRTVSEIVPFLRAGDSSRVSPANSPGMTHILTPAQAATALQALEKESGTDLLSAPRLTTLSGRQAEISIESQTKLNGVRYKKIEGATTNFAAVNGPVPTGPVLSILADVSPDKSLITIHLFCSVQLWKGDEKDSDGTPLPVVEKVSAVGTATIRDGQTVFLSSDNNSRIGFFVTTTLIDPAGNRLNLEGAVPDSIPPQTPPK